MTRSAVEAARAMGPAILAHRAETEANRRLAAPIVERLVEERLCRMLLDRDLGGHPASPLEALEVYEVLAGFEASVPWLLWNNSLVCSFSRFVGKGAREELFADPTWLYAQSTRPSGALARAGEGFRVSGRWALVSGCEHAEWLMLHGLVSEPGAPEERADEPDTRFAFVRRGDFEILDTWKVGGLRGTGSHDVVVRDVFVPSEHTLSPEAGASAFDSPIGRVPIIVHMVAGFAAQLLGVARASVASIVEAARTKVTSGPTPDLRDRPRAQLLVASHSAALAAARSHLHACARSLWDRTVAGSAPGLSELGAAYAASLHAVAASRDAVGDMYALGGTSSLYTDNLLERAHRDTHAMLRHMVAQPSWLEDAGRVELGLGPANPQYAL